jgi:hypothetical protein
VSLNNIRCSTKLQYTYMQIPGALYVLRARPSECTVAPKQQQHKLERVYPPSPLSQFPL